MTKTYLHQQQILRNQYRPLNDHINTSISFLGQGNIMFVVCICIIEPKDEQSIKDNQVIQKPHHNRKWVSLKHKMSRYRTLPFAVWAVR